MKKKFNSVLIIGMGLIGSSISRALNENHVANKVYGLDYNDLGRNLSNIYKLKK